MIQIDQVPLNQQIAKNSAETSARTPMVHCEEKSLALVSETVAKFKNSGQLRVNHCQPTFVKAKVCQMFPKHQRFIACEFELFSFKESIQPVVEIPVRKFLNNEPDIREGQEVVQMPRMYMWQEVVKHLVWKGKASFCPLRFLNNTLYISGNRAVRSQGSKRAAE